MEELQGLKNKIDALKTKLAIKQSEKDKLVEQLKTDFGIGVNQISSKMEETSNKIDKLEDRKSKLIDKIIKDLKDYENI